MLQSSSSEKKLVKPLKNCFFGPNLHRKGVIMGYAQDGKKFFLAEITKADHQLSESFYFIKISYVLTELWIFFYLEWCFLSKKCHFHLKQLCPGPVIINLMDNIQRQHEIVYLEQQPHLPSTSTEANDMNTMLTTEIQNNSVSPFLADLIDLVASNMDNYQIWSNQKGA